MLSNLMQRISKTSDTEERNERLQLLNDGLEAKLRDLQSDLDIEKQRNESMASKI